MSMLGRAPLRAVAGLTFGLLACAAAFGAADVPTQREQFHARLDEAREAYDRGDAPSAVAPLRKALRLVCSDPWAWLALGFLGQALFSARFVVQWLASEKKGESVVPVSFWYLSIGGSLTVLTYAVWRLDPVFMLAYGFNSFVYVRNLMLIYRKRRVTPAAAAG